MLKMILIGTAVWILLAFVVAMVFGMIAHHGKQGPPPRLNLKTRPRHKLPRHGKLSA